MIREIRYVPNKILSTPAEPLSGGEPFLPQLILDLKDTILAHDAVGLAAPQIGVSKQIFCYRMFSVNAEKKRIFSDEIKTIINPKIIRYDGEQIQGWEGCLSLPDIRLKVSRAESILLVAMDEQFKSYQNEFSGYEARVIQHETDHLNGIFMLSRFGGMLEDYFLDYNKNITASLQR
jgi:peptide deformylase